MGIASDRARRRRTRPWIVAMAGQIMLLAAATGGSGQDYRVDAGGRVPTAAGTTYGPAVFRFTVAGGPFFLTDIDVHVDLVHTWTEDLRMTLRSPDGTEVRLFTNRGSVPAFQDFNDTVFDDEAAAAISAGTPPFAGSFRPEEPLSAFDGIDSNGMWSLTIDDDFFGDYGYLYRSGDARFESRREALAGSFLRIAGSSVILDSVVPGSGSETGGDFVNLRGAGFTDAADTVVEFGGVRATLVGVSAGRVQVRTPAGSGTVDVTVTNSNGSSTLAGAYGYIDPAIAARFGHVNVALGDRENVLLVNGSAGDSSRVVVVETRKPLVVDVASPSSRPSSAFALYFWTRAPDAGSLAEQPSDLGAMVFPTPFNPGATPQPKKIANNTGVAAFGPANVASISAPSTVVNRPRGLKNPITVAIQGIIQDDGSRSASRYSITNAVILQVVPDAIMDVVSTDSSGVPTSGSDPVISADERYVAYTTFSTGPGVVIVHNRMTGAKANVSVSSAGVPANHGCFRPALSSNGRFVVFGSIATNLVVGVADFLPHVYRHDRDADGDGFFDEPGSIRTVLVDANDAGQPANALSLAYAQAISDDGNLVVFASTADNLVPGGDGAAGWDCFIRDLSAGTTRLVNVTTSGVQSALGAFGPSISGNGRVVAFESSSYDMIPGVYGWQIYARDLLGGVTSLVSADGAGEPADDTCFSASISSTGRFVAFVSRARNLVTPDDNGSIADVFVRDRSGGTIVRASVSTSGEQANDESEVPWLSGDGSVVVFYSAATNIVAGDGNGEFDAFAHRLQGGTTAAVSRNGAGILGNAASGVAGSGVRCALSRDASHATFWSLASNLGPADDNGVADVYVRTDLFVGPGGNGGSP